MHINQTKINVKLDSRVSIVNKKTLTALKRRGEFRLQKAHIIARTAANVLAVTPYRHEVAATDS